ncbi:hypothetical protein GCM10009087_00640 [Sphingomonas oligophenolica]|uniref:Lytic transglycosylase domain-containing protein n=1 Tax=Sphingomonas oligophenolica TaxID=301154 RepID=A0ABU9Y1E9_9SPHN
MTVSLVRAILTALCLVSLTATRAAAGPRGSMEQQREALIGDCIERAAAGRPWLAKTLWALRDQEGGSVGVAVRNANGTEDLGPLQVNSWWASRIAAVTGRRPAQVRWWLQHDVCFNVDAARWVFLSALAATKDYWKAVGVYHSPVACRQRVYVNSVASHLAARAGRVWTQNK